MADTVDHWEEGREELQIVNLGEEEYIVQARIKGLEGWRDVSKDHEALCRRIETLKARLSRYDGEE